MLISRWGGGSFLNLPGHVVDRDGFLQIGSGKGLALDITPLPTQCGG